MLCITPACFSTFYQATMVPTLANFLVYLVVIIIIVYILYKGEIVLIFQDLKFQVISVQSKVATYSFQNCNAHWVLYFIIFGT